MKKRGRLPIPNLQPYCSSINSLSRRIVRGKVPQRVMIALHDSGTAPESAQEEFLKNVCLCYGCEMQSIEGDFLRNFNKCDVLRILCVLTHFLNRVQHPKRRKCSRRKDEELLPGCSNDRLGKVSRVHDQILEVVL